MTVQPLPPPADTPEDTQLTIATIADFAAVDEETAIPLIGDEETCLLSHGGMMVLYGDGGAGKTTLELDFLCHLAAAEDWLGLPIDSSARILLIENEGPRGMFRKKIRRKLGAWELGDVNGNISVLEDPWALFSFGKEVFREQLRLAIEMHEFDVVAAGPVNTLGIQGGGTPEEVSAFVYEVNLVRQSCSRPVAALFVHHENKAGDVSGAWEGVPDTLAHISNQGNGSTRLYWQKVRWGPSLHGKTWQLSWADGEGFELNEEAVRSDSEIEADMVAFVALNPGANWNQIDGAVEGRGERKRALRDRLLSESQLINKARGHRFSLFLPESANASERPGASARMDAGMDALWDASATQRRECSASQRPDSSRDALRGTHYTDASETDTDEYEEDLPF